MFLYRLMSVDMDINAGTRDEHLPVSCEGGYLSYGDYCGTYFKD